MIEVDFPQVDKTGTDPAYTHIFFDEQYTF